MRSATPSLPWWTHPHEVWAKWALLPFRWLCQAFCCGKGKCNQCRGWLRSFTWIAGDSFWQETCIAHMLPKTLFCKQQAFNWHDCHVFSESCSLQLSRTTNRNPKLAELPASKKDAAALDHVHKFRDPPKTCSRAYYCHFTDNEIQAHENWIHLTKVKHGS